MDERTFGELTKHIAAAPSRRGMMRALSGGIAAAALATVGRQTPMFAEDIGDEGYCRAAGFPCRDKLQCCARKCVNGTLLGQPAKVCGCNKKGKDCIRGLGQTCCSRRCSKRGKCK
jgi:hypothetical protein